MSQYLKYFYILVFIVTGIYVILFISQNFASWKSLYGEMQKSQTSTKTTNDYQPARDGVLFTEKGKTLAESYPCVSSKEEVLELIKSDVEKEYDSQSYFELNVEPLLVNTEVENDGIFYKAKLPTEIDLAKYTLKQNIFDCAFFEPVFTEYIPVDQEHTDLFIGTLKNVSEENLGRLVELLYNYQIIDLELFGKEIELTERNISYTNDEILRTDSGTYRASSGIFSDDSKNYTVKLIYILNNQTGDLLFTKVIE